MTDRLLDPEGLGNIVKSAKARGVIYAIWFVAGIVIGAAQIAYPDPDPQYLDIAGRVWAYLGLYVSVLAYANRQTTPTVVYAPEARPSTINTDTVVMESKPTEEYPEIP